MSRHSVSWIPGEAYNEALFSAVQRIVEAADVDIDWVPVSAPHFDPETGWDAGTWESVTGAVLSTGLALCGGMGTAEDQPTLRSPHVVMREHCGCFAGIRPVRSIRGLEGRAELDVVIRETTEDVYAGHEHEVMPGGVSTIKVVTRKASERIADFAFWYARRHGRKKVTVIHKANIMKLTDGLFLRTAQEVAAEYPEIELDHLIVDNASMQMVLRPERYDVVLCGNLYGDILSALAAGLVGGVVAKPGIAVADEAVIFESLGTQRDPSVRAGNPLGLLLPTVHLLDHLGQDSAAVRIWAAIEIVLGAGNAITADLGGEANTEAMTDAIIDAL